MSDSCIFRQHSRSAVRVSWNLNDRSSKSTATGSSSTLPTTTRRARCMANDRYLSCPSFSHPTLTISWRIGDNISVRVRNQTTFSFVKVEQQSIDIVHGLQHCFTSVFPVHGKKMNPHLLRDMTVTHVRNQRVSEQELPILAVMFRARSVPVGRFVTTLRAKISAGLDCLADLLLRCVRNQYRLRILR